MCKPIVRAAAALMLLSAPALAQHASATANLIDAEGREIGTVTFTETPSGHLVVMVEAAGLPPGPHGFHVHERGQCDPGDGFESAGGHHAGEHDHGVMAEDGPHPGDFPNVHVGADGVLKVEFFAPGLSIGDGEHPLMDADGSAVIIHADPDDYESQPSGNAGARIVCGVVEQPT